MIVVIVLFHLCKQSNSVDFEAAVVAQLDSLMEALLQRRQHLLEQVNLERQNKEKVFASQISKGTLHMKNMAGLLQISIEMLKDPNPLFFLQVRRDIIYYVAAIIHIK